MTHRWSGGVDCGRRRRNVYDKKHPEALDIYMTYY